MNRITSYLIIVIAMVTSSDTTAQNIFKVNDANWVVVIESILPVAGNSVTKSRSTGVVVEKPLGQFSVGLSVHYSKTSEFSNYETITTITPITPTGSFSSRSKSLMPTTVYDRTTAKQAYVTAGIELKYRLPCNCFFAYANINHAEQINYQEVSTERTSSARTYNYHDPTEAIFAMGIGVGANIPITKQIRGMLKVGRQFYDGFSGYFGEHRKEPFIFITVGVQYGIE